MSSAGPLISVAVISFNTCDLLRSCLLALQSEIAEISHEIIVVDNASRDRSAAMVRQEFPGVQLIASSVNLGFGAANNLALASASGRYFVMLNSDAFLAPGAMQRAIDHMEQTPDCALGGGRLVGRDGTPQPSARCFHSVWRDATLLTGIAARFPTSAVLGGLDRTWTDLSKSSEVDWVPGAFSIVRSAAFRDVQGFDPVFFLYYEEVDLCVRLKQAGYSIWYWPDVVITHIGGESSRQLTEMQYSRQSSQVVLWRMRSTLLYYRKHHGVQVWLAKWLEKSLYGVSVIRNHFSSQHWRRARELYHRNLLQLMNRAWKETSGGRISPPRPW